MDEFRKASVDIDDSARGFELNSLRSAVLDAHSYHDESAITCCLHGGSILS